MGTYLHVSRHEVNQNPITLPGLLKLLMGTYLHVSRHEVNQNPITLPGLKQKLISSDVLGPKIASEALSQHQI